MAKIKDALSTLPAKPALFIAPILVVVVLSLYYRDQYVQCSGIRHDRAALSEMLRSMDSGAVFRLADFATFKWNKVRIVNPVKPGTIADECPLDWNWTRGERDSLLADGQLTAIIFGLDGKVVRYLELRSDDLEFHGAEGNLTPQQAVFKIRANDSDDAVVLNMLE